MAVAVNLRGLFSCAFVGTTDERMGEVFQSAMPMQSGGVLVVGEGPDNGGSKCVAVCRHRTDHPHKSHSDEKSHIIIYKRRSQKVCYY